jgi:hypothetical protein
MVFVIVGIVVVAACVTVLWYLRSRALARALTAQLAQPAASLPIRIQAGVLIAHDLILEDIAAAMSHTLSTSLDQEDDRDRHAAGLPVHPMQTVLERAEAWAPSAIAVDFDVERLPGRVDVQDLESELTELSGSLVAASGATAAAVTSLREIDALLGRLPADAEDDVRWFRSLRLHMDALGLEATDGRLSSGPTYGRQRDEFPTRTATFIRECADGWNERFAATRGDVRSTATPPPLTSAHPEPLGPMVVELIASATALAESASAFLGKQRSRADGGADGTQDESARRLTWLDELQQNLSLAGRKVEEGSVLEASFILNGTPIPAMPWWRPGWRYRKAAHRVERHLRGLVAAQRQAIEMWAAAAAESWRSAVATYGEWVTAEGQALSSTRLSTRTALAESAGALQQEVCELLCRAPTPSNDGQLRFVAATSCAVAITDACVPGWSARLAGSVVGGPQLGSELEDGRKLGGTHRQLEHAITAADRLAGQVGDLQPGTGEAAAGAFERILAAARPPDDVRTKAIEVFGIMHDAGATDTAWSSALALGDWATSGSATRTGGGPGGGASQSSTPSTGTGSTALDDLWAPVVSALAGWVDRPDPNAARADRLEEFMGTLGLSPDQSTLATTGRYQDARIALAEHASPVVTGFVETVGSALDEGRSTFLGLTERLASSAVSIGASTATSALSLFHRDVGQYLQRCAAVLAAPLPTTETVPALGTTPPAGGAPPTAISEAARILAGLASSITEPQVWSAAFRVSEVPVPVAPGWEPCDEYVAASEQIAAVFSTCSDDLLASLVDGLGDAGRRVLDQSRQLCRSVEEAFESAAAAQATAWREVETAAYEVQREAVEKLLTEPTDPDAALQIRAALGVHVLDTLAAENVSEAVDSLIPVGPSVPADADADEKLRIALERATRYQTASLALAGADGLLLGALASDGFASFSPAVFGLSGVGDNVHSAFNGLLSAVHQTNVHQDIVQSALQTLHLDLINLLVPNDVHESLLGLLHGASHGFPYAGWALADLVGSDGPAQAAAVLLKSNLESGLLSVLHEVLGTPGGHEAVFHVEHAGKLVGLDVLHGALAHVPIITAVLATAREVRLQREHEIALQSSVANAAIDVAFVGGGVLAAVTATGPLHLGPHAVVTIPAAMLGGYLGRLGLKRRHRKKLESLQLECKRLYATFEKQHSVMVQQCAQTVSGGMDRARAAFLESTGEAPSMEPVPRADADPMVRALGAATTTYAEYIERLLKAVTDGTGDSVSSWPELEELRTSVGIARQTSPVGEELLGDDDWVGAALAISATPLPVYDAWMPSDGYGRTCQEWAERLTAGSDAQRRATRSWLESALVSFEVSKSDLDKQLQEADGVLKREKVAAWAPVEKAAEDFKVELARAGGKH